MFQVGQITPDRTIQEQERLGNRMNKTAILNALESTGVYIKGRGDFNSTEAFDIMRRAIVAALDEADAVVMEQQAVNTGGGGGGIEQLTMVEIDAEDIYRRQLIDGQGF
jgi:hypothetical protein